MKHLRVIIVGAGIGGLATALALATDGHEIIVLDGVKEFSEVGAGIRVPPNSSRLLRAWGVDLDQDLYDKHGLTVMTETSLGNRFVDGITNEVLLSLGFGEDARTRYGAPYRFLHRADLVDALVMACDGKRKGKRTRDPRRSSSSSGSIRIVLGSAVTEYDYERPAVKTEDGKWYGRAAPADADVGSGAVDLVISAEGIKSSAREAVNGEPIEPRDTGDVAYRILVPAGPLLEDSDSEMRELVRQPWAMHWMGPEAHAVGYPLRGGRLYNIILDTTHASDCGAPVGEGEWKRSADTKELIERFQGWCEPVRKLCGMTGEYLKWKLADLETSLKRWVHPSGKVALLGDACHPMMPYLAQGAAQAIEDAATLRAALAARDDDDGGVGEALRVYERERAPRAEYVAKNTRVMQEWLHLYDGPARDERDRMMTRDDENNPMFWGDSRRKDWLFGYDAGRLHEQDELHIPPLPPMPPAEASVYLKGGKIK